MAFTCANCCIPVDDVCPICGDCAKTAVVPAEPTDAEKADGDFKARVNTKDLSDPQEPKKPEFSFQLKTMYIPLMGILVDVAQFTSLPWQLLLPWPKKADDNARDISAVVFVQFWDINIGLVFEIAQFVCCFFVISFLLIINAPAQKLVLAFGNSVVGGLWFAIISFQTVLFMPITKFALYGFYCTRYAQVFNWENPDKDVCWKPRHIAMLVCGSITVIGLYISVLSFIKLLFTPLEKIKRNFAKYPFATKTPKFAILLTTIKLVCAAVQVIVKEVMEDSPHTRDIILGLILMFALGSFLVFLGAALPYKNQFTTCFVYGLLTGSFTSNVIGLMVAIVNNKEDWNFVTIWCIGVPISSVIAYHSWKFILVKKIRMIVAAAKETKSLECADDIQGPIPEVFCELCALLSQPSTVETVSFSGAFLTSTQVSQLCASMASNMRSNIQTVDFSRNSISGLSHGVDILIAKSETVKTVILDHNCLPSGIPLLATELARNKTLVKLSMNNCGLEGDAGVNLGQALMRNKTLQDLNIGMNNLEEKGALGLAAGLAKNITIVALDVSWNQMGPEGLQAILNTFNRPAQINMLCNKVPQADLTRLKAQMAKAAEGGDPGPTIEELFKAVGVTNIYDLVGAVLKLDPAVAMHALCEEFYIRLVSDRRLLPFFANISMGRMRNLQKQCLTEALGGPKVYKGLDLKTGHAHLAIDDDVYDATIAHLFGAILKFIPEPPGCVVKELVGLTEALRPLVVNTAIEDGMCYNAGGDPLTINVKDSSKAAPFLCGTMWSTGLCKKRSGGEGDGHPALAVSDKSRGCCPCCSGAAPKEG